MKKVNKNNQASRSNSQALPCIFPGQTATSHRHYTCNARIIPIGAPFPPSHNEFVAKNYPVPLPSLSTMKKTFNPKKCTPFPPPPSTFSYIYKTNKTLTSSPLPLNSEKKYLKKFKVHPFPRRTMNTI